MGSQMSAFKFEDLGKVDSGKVVVALNHALLQCIRDVQDRPFEEAARTVSLKIDLTPILDAAEAKEGRCVLDTIGMQFKLNPSMPKQQTMVYPMIPTSSGALLFNPDSPRNPRQHTLDFDGGQADPETGEVPLEEEDVKPFDGKLKEAK